MSYRFKDKYGNVLFDTSDLSTSDKFFGIVTGHNLFDINDINVFFNKNISDTGVLTESKPTNYYSVTGFIPCESGKTYSWASFHSDGTKKASNVYGVLWFDRNKNFISISENTNGNYSAYNTAPEGAKYLRLRIRTKDSFEDITRLFVFEKWYAPTEFEPYEERNALLQQYSPAIAFNPLDFKGKTLTIVGDSISTLDGENAPELTITEFDVGKELSAYPTFYDLQENLTVGGHTIVESDLGKELVFTPSAEDIGKSIGIPVTYYKANHKPWWKWLCESLQMKSNNVSWSGASTTSHEANSKYYCTSYAWHDSQIRRCGIRKRGLMERDAPDYIVLFRCCNDYSHAKYAYVNPGTFENNDFVLPTTDELSVNGTTEFGIKEGLCLTITKLRQAYPKAKIFVATVMTIKRGDETEFPCKNGKNTLPQFNKAVLETAEYFGCETIRFDKIFSFEGTKSDFDHPSEREHYEMFTQALKDFLK